MSDHPILWRQIPPEQCSLCHGHLGGEPYLKMETPDGTPRLETWEGPTVVLCGRCIRGMNESIGGGTDVGNKSDATKRVASVRGSNAKRSATPGTQRRGSGTRANANPVLGGTRKPANANPVSQPS